MHSADERNQFTGAYSTALTAARAPTRLSSAPRPRPRSRAPCAARLHSRLPQALRLPSRCSACRSRPRSACWLCVGGTLTERARDERRQRYVPSCPPRARGHRVHASASKTSRVSASMRPVRLPFSSRLPSAHVSRSTRVFKLAPACSPPPAAISSPGDPPAVRAPHELELACCETPRSVRPFSVLRIQGACQRSRRRCVCRALHECPAGVCPGDGALACRLESRPPGLRVDRRA